MILLLGSSPFAAPNSPSTPKFHHSLLFYFTSNKPPRYSPPRSPPSRPKFRSSLARSFPAPPVTLALTLDLSISCRLFPLWLRLPSFVFNSLQPLFPKCRGVASADPLGGHPGGGYRCETFATTASLHPACPELRGKLRGARYPSPSPWFAPLGDSCALLYLPLE